ncbi:MAG: hypothetical protein K2X82_16780 [Gemmataceae bacterium]|nr:hypothetical protein [Gemmataceae bacterium]
MTATDLWPDFKVEKKARSVRHILDEAGGGLKQKTGGVVEFRTHHGGASGDAAFPFLYLCTLVVPKLGYDYSLLRVVSAPTGFPVRVISDQGTHGEFADEPGLLAELAKVFRSERTQQIVQNLISMATD